MLIVEKPNMEGCIVWGIFRIWSTSLCWKSMSGWMGTCLENVEYLEDGLLPSNIRGRTTWWNLTALLIHVHFGPRRCRFWPCSTDLNVANQHPRQLDDFVFSYSLSERVSFASRRRCGWIWTKILHCSRTLGVSYMYIGTLAHTSVLLQSE